MHEEEFDGDPRLQLPKGMPILTPERARMLGFESHEDVTHAEVKIVSLMKFLHEKRIIDDEELFDGETYGVWRSQATRHFRNEIIPYDTKADKARGDSFGEYGYILISQHLHKHDAEIIADAIDTDCAQIRARMAMLLREDPVRHAQAYRSLRNTYQKSFARLVRLMPEMRDRVAEIEKRAEDKIDA